MAGVDLKRLAKIIRQVAKARQEGADTLPALVGEYRREIAKNPLIANPPPPKPADPVRVTNIFSPLPTGGPPPRGELQDAVSALTRAETVATRVRQETPLASPLTALEELKKAEEVASTLLGPVLPPNLADANLFTAFRPDDLAAVAREAGTLQAAESTYATLAERAGVALHRFDLDRGWREAVPDPEAARGALMREYVRFTAARMRLASAAGQATGAAAIPGRKGQQIQAARLLRAATFNMARAASLPEGSIRNTLSVRAWDSLAQAYSLMDVAPKARVGKVTRRVVPMPAEGFVDSAALGDALVAAIALGTRTGALKGPPRGADRVMRYYAARVASESGGMSGLQQMLERSGEFVPFPVALRNRLVAGFTSTDEFDEMINYAAHASDGSLINKRLRAGGDAFEAAIEIMSLPLSKQAGRAITDAMPPQLKGFLYDVGPGVDLTRLGFGEGGEEVFKRLGFSKSAADFLRKMFKRAKELDDELEGSLFDARLIDDVIEEVTPQGRIRYVEKGRRAKLRERALRKWGDGVAEINKKLDRRFGNMRFTPEDAEARILGADFVEKGVFRFTDAEGNRVEVDVIRQLLALAARRGFTIRTVRMALNPSPVHARMFKEADRILKAQPSRVRFSAAAVPEVRATLPKRIPKDVPDELVARATGKIFAQQAGKGAEKAAQEAGEKLGNAIVVTTPSGNVRAFTDVRQAVDYIRRSGERVEGLSPAEVADAGTLRNTILRRIADVLDKRTPKGLVALVGEEDAQLLLQIKEASGGKSVREILNHFRVRRTETAPRIGLAEVQDEVERFKDTVKTTFEGGATVAGQTDDVTQRAAEAARAFQEDMSAAQLIEAIEDVILRVEERFTKAAMAELQGLSSTPALGEVVQDFIRAGIREVTDAEEVIGTMPAEEKQFILARLANEISDFLEHFERTGGC